MITVDLESLETPHPLDVDQEAHRAAEALIGIAHVFARGSSAQAFCLLIATVEAFALDSNMQCDLIDLALGQLSEVRASFDQDVNDPDETESALDGVTPHDPTGSPAEASVEPWHCPVQSNECTIRRQCTNKCGRLNAAAYEAARAADPDPRDDETGGDQLAACAGCEAPFGCPDGRCALGKEEARVPLVVTPDPETGGEG